MAGVKFEKGSREWYMFQDYWNLCQKYWIPENDDEYWDQMIMDANEFMKKHEDISLSKELIFALINSLDSQYKRRLLKNEKNI